MAVSTENFRNYRVDESIGSGRFTLVYKAEKVDIHKLVALKLLRPEFADRVDIRDQFRERVRQQAKLAHPRLVRVEDLREEHGQLFAAMEYMPLKSLGSWIGQNGMLSFRQIAVITADAAEALDYLHGLSLMHGDIKPSNILLMEDPTQKGILRAKLSDLRVPVAMGVSDTFSESLTQLTPEYVSPEQASGDSATPRSDQYALGVVVYELLCGQAPFHGKNQVDLYIDHQKAPPLPPSRLNDRVTLELEQVVLRALEKSPSERYSSCGDFARALRSAAAATEEKHFKTLIENAEALLEKQEFEPARAMLREALLIQPENEKARQVMTSLEQQEGLLKNYQQAFEALQKADTKARSIRRAAPDYPDDARYLHTFAPPPAPFWKQFKERWRWAGVLAGSLLLFSLVCLLSVTAWIDTAGGQSIQPTLVALDRTATRTFTPVPTSTRTPTLPPTVTATATATLRASATPTPIGGGSGRIAFSSGRNEACVIFGMNVASGSRTTLASNNLNCSFIVWSADRKKIVFVAGPSDSGQIYTMNADGTRLINLANESELDGNPVLSPNGKKVAFVSGSWTRRQIYVINADGTGRTNVSKPNLFDTSPVWSPDGKQIAFVHYQGARGQIYVMNADGTGRTHLSNNAEHESNPVWSPDGKKIAFVAGFWPKLQIYVVNADGTGRISLSKNDTVESDPAWSPDGKRIAFVAGAWPDGQIYIMNADGTNRIKLSKESTENLAPIWSPDGRKIAFTSWSSGIYIVNADGSNLLNLASNGAYPVWLP